MSVLAKKLHVMKTGGVDEPITLYSTVAECGEPNLKLLVDGALAYAKMGKITDTNASSLRVFRDSDGKTYAVLKTAEEVVLNNYWIRANGAIVPINASDVETVAKTMFCKSDIVFLVDFPSCTAIEDGDSSWDEITNGGFAFCPNLQKVTLLNATKIGAGAFMASTALTDVSLPSATEIGMWSFNNCTGLTSLSLPNLKKLGVAAFANCIGLSEISLPKLESISDSVFYNCNALTELVLPSVTNISKHAFSGWTGTVHLAASNLETIEMLSGYPEFNGAVELLFDL